MRDQAPLQFCSFSVQAAAANNENMENCSQLIRCCLPNVRMTSYSACRPYHVDTSLVGFGDLAWGRGEGGGIESRNCLPMAFNAACLPAINCDHFFSCLDSTGGNRYRVFLSSLTRHEVSSNIGPCWEDQSMRV